MILSSSQLSVSHLCSTIVVFTGLLLAVEHECDAERVLFSYGFGTSIPTNSRRRLQQRYSKASHGPPVANFLLMCQRSAGSKSAPVREVELVPKATAEQ